MTTAMLKLQEKLHLTAANIDKASEMFFRVCEELHVSREETIKQRLALENVLMTWAESFGEEQEFELISYKRFFTPYVAVRCANRASVNPFSSEGDGFSGSILRICTFLPEYYYHGGVNHAVFRLPRRQLNPVLEMALVFAVSIAVGLIGLHLFPESLISSLMDYVVSPLYSKFLDVLNCIAGPLVFFSVAWGIYGIGDVATFNRLGKRLIVSCLLCVLVACSLSVLSFPLFHLRFSGKAADAAQLFQVFQLFLDMLPATIVEPFANGNTLQLVVLAVALGIALLYLGKRSASVANAINQINDIVRFILNAVCKLVPIFIALVIINLMWSDGTSVLGSTWRLAVAEVIGLYLFCVVLAAVVSIRLRVNPSMVVRKNMPSTLIALSTASSTASFSALVKVCENGFGIKKTLTSFGVPLCMVMQRAGIGISYALSILYTAEISGAEISVSWLLMAVIVSAVTAIATPPIPGSGTIGFAMLFSQMNLPMDCFGIMVALDMLMDFFHTGGNVFCTSLVLTTVADHFDLIDRDVLMAEKK